MTELGFHSYKADPDVWFRPSTKSDGTDYYQYVIIYTDDNLEIKKENERFLCEELGNVFTLKENSIGPPTQYLGNKVFLSFFCSGLRGPKAYSLWGGVVPSPSIGYDYL